ncbi:hypothetical protein FACS1894217_00940 [Clostridia bacterium]|nr:hypothetical protein FACS1894217_00940 [Clostridia bacterium]
MDDYLAAIYRLGDARDPVRLTDLALALGLSKSSVSRAVGILCERGLLTHSRYGNIVLTDEGFALGRAIQARREVFKRFLIEILGLPADVAAADAGRLEHAASPDTAVALERFVNR